MSVRVMFARPSVRSLDSRKCAAEGGYLLAAVIRGGDGPLDCGLEEVWPPLRYSTPCSTSVVLDGCRGSPALSAAWDGGPRCRFRCCVRAASRRLMPSTARCFWGAWCFRD